MCWIEVSVQAPETFRELSLATEHRLGEPDSGETMKQVGSDPAREFQESCQRQVTTKKGKKFEGTVDAPFAIRKNHTTLVNYG